MSLYVDGERSRQRLGFAKSLLNKLKMMGLKTKTLLYDGFLYRVKIIAPGLDKIAVTAPMGAAVVCSSETGMQLFTADYWLSTLTTGRDVHVVDTVTAPGILWFTLASYAVQPNVKFVPEAVQFDLYGSPTSATYLGTNPTPGTHFFGSEFFWLSVVGDPAVSAFRMAETFLNFYTASGKADKRIGMQIESDTSGMPYLVVQPLPSEETRTVTHWAGRYLFSVNAPYDLVVASVFQGGSTGTGYGFFYGYVMFAGAPPALQTLLLQRSPYLGQFAVGNYVFALSSTDQPTLLHVCGAIDSFFDTYYFTANPAQKPWKLFYSIYTLGAGSISTYTVNTTLLDTVSGGYVISAGVVDYLKAWQILAHFLPWPNVSYYAVSDSAMFHAPNGDVYSWTRKYGPIKFTTSGMFATSIVLPTQVTSTPGVRPELYYAGYGDYVCICTKNSKTRLYTLPAEQALYDADWNGVVGLYYGSPFAAWSALPLPESGWHLLHVNVVNAYNGDCTLLGVMTEDSAPHTYHLCVLEYKNSGGQWRRLSKINAGTIDVDTSRWATSLFGDAPYVNDLRLFPSPPPVLPQMPAPPYAEYAAVLP